MPRIRYAQVDIMKGLAILGVIFTHALTDPHQRQVFTVFHANQAVPVFIALMAFNLGGSLTISTHEGVRGHFGRRMGRLLWPFLLILGVS